MEGNPVSISSVATLAQSDARLWQSLLEFSGGALETSKCFWNAIVPSEMGGFMNRQEIIDAGRSVSISGPESDIVINLATPSDAHKTLGCFKSPLGDQTAQTSALRSKASKFAQCLAAASLSQYKGRLACEAIIGPALSYPLATAYLSDNQILQIQRPYMSNAARCCGFNGKTSRAVLFGPVELGGFALTNLAASQTWAHIDMLMHHLR